jgi:hypothetical protein
MARPEIQSGVTENHVATLEAVCRQRSHGEPTPSQDCLGHLLQFSQRCSLWGTGQEQYRGICSGFGKGLERGTIGGHHIRDDRNGRGITTRLAREFVEHGAPLPNAFWGAPGGHPAIAIGHRPVKDLPRCTTEKNGRVGLLHGPWEGAHQGKVIVGAVILRCFMGPECLHGFNGFPRLGLAVRKIAAHNLGLFFVPAGANTKEKPAPGHVVECRNLLGEEEGVALRDKGDAGA